MVRSDFLTYWNFITGENECKWGAIESNRDRMNWRGADSIAAFARRNDIPWNFHALFTSGSYRRSAPVDTRFFDLQGRVIRMQRGGNRFPIAPLRRAPGTVISFTDESYRCETGMDR